MKFKEIYRSVLRFIGNYILAFAVDLLCGTLIVTKENEKSIQKLEAGRKNYILAFWHGTMLFPWFEKRDKKFLGLISQSKDGELLARMLKKWNYKVTRGSSSKGGDVALGIIVDYLKYEGSVAITPDGPRGPRHEMKAGAVVAAKKSGLPLVLLGVGYKNKFTLNNWDKFEIPKPFSKVKLIFSEPIYVNYDLTYEETSKVISECELKLNYLQNNAEKF